MDKERIFILCLFGASLAMLAWRFKASGHGVDTPTAVHPDRVPVQAPPDDPRHRVGVSFIPDSSPEQFGPWFYTANMPQYRGTLAPMSSLLH